MTFRCSALPLLLVVLSMLANPCGPILQAQKIKLRDSTVANIRDERTAELPSEITTRLESFFSQLLKSSPETAFFTLFQNTPFNDKNEVIEQITATSRKSVAELGGYTSYEYLDAETFGEKAITVSYITEMPKKLLRWRFFFYSPGGTEWTLANLKVDDYRNYLARNPNRQAPPSSVQLEVEKFFVSMLSANARQGMQDLLAGSEVPNYANSIEEFVRLIDTARIEYGDMQAYELYDRTKVGTRYVLLTYFAYHKTEPLRWQFTYRLDGPGEWTLVNLRFDDLLDESVLLD
ncbi:MAG: hypothetical protein AAF571_03600 [Verrucomicrobiota bacterium]